ncbi:MAG TPA: lysophospholipid acyltransferase family protein [Anaerolineaceae bacterium]
MLIQSFLYSRIATGLAMFLSQTIPQQAGYSVAENIARFIGRLSGTGQRQAVRLNQWVVSCKQLSGLELDRVVEAVFRFTGYAMYDFYHNINRPKVILDRVLLSPRMERFVNHERHERGCMFVVPHIGNFDFAGRALALRGVNFQVLSYPQPPGAYKVQNHFREMPGMEVTPMSLESMRSAAQRMANGGIVITGLDRPLPDSNYHPRFFGIPAPLPVAYIRLAMKANVPVIVGAVQRMTGGRYLLDASEPIEMQRNEDLKTELESNAEAVLRRAEDFIRRAPQQWLMFYPVWPQIKPNVP